MTKKRLFRWGLLLLIGSILFPVFLYAQQQPPAVIPPVGQIFSPERLSTTLGLLLPLSTIGLLPFFIVSTTSFLRIVIVLGFIRTAIGTNQSPPNMIVTSMALFLTIYIMTPIFTNIQKEVFEPYNAGQMSQFEAVDKSMRHLKGFMLKHTREKDIALFLEFSRVEPPEDFEDIPTFVLIPAFIISELKVAFQIGFLLYIPFVVIDLIVSNILLSLGMFMLSPAMVSMPFKILLIVLSDAWHLLIQGILITYQ